MAWWMEPTPEDIKAWNAWVETRPPVVREVARKFQPWELYKIRETGHRVTLVSFGEPHHPTDPVTLTVHVSGDFNFVAFERQVFGIKPEDLLPSELPSPNELTGNAGIIPVEAKTMVEDIQ